MTPTEIISLGYLQAHTTATEVDPSDVTYANSYLFLNLAIDKIMNRIITDIDESFLYEIWTTNAGEKVHGEYPLPIQTGTGVGETFYAGAKKIERVFVNYENPDDYTDMDEWKTHYKEAKEIDQSMLKSDWNYFLQEQPEDEPIFFVGDRSIFIAPQFEADDIGAEPNNQIKMEGVRTWKKLNYTDDSVLEIEHLIGVPREFHYILAIGWESEFKRSRLRPDEKNEAAAEFAREIEKLIVDLGSRTLAPDEAQLPSDVSLQY